MRASGRRQKSAIIVSNAMPRTSTPIGLAGTRARSRRTSRSARSSGSTGPRAAGAGASRTSAASPLVGPSSNRLPSARSRRTAPPNIGGSRLTGTYKASPSFQEKESPTSSAWVGSTTVVSVSSAKPPFDFVAFRALTSAASSSAVATTWYARSFEPAASLRRARAPRRGPGTRARGRPSAARRRRAGAARDRPSRRGAGPPCRSSRGASRGARARRARRAARRASSAGSRAPRRARASSDPCSCTSFDGRLLADAGHARHVVGRVAHEPEHVDHAVGPRRPSARRPSPRRRGRPPRRAAS